MTTEIKVPTSTLSIEGLIRLAISDNEALTERVIIETMGKTVQLNRLGYKFSIALKTAYEYLNKANALFLRNESLEGEYLFEDQIAVLIARLDKLEKSGKYDYLLLKLYESISELDLTVYQLHMGGVDVES